MKRPAPRQRAKTTPRKFSEGGGYRLRGVSVFTSGKHRDKEYTTDDLDSMVANFRKHSTGPRPLVEVPAVLGHEEDQEYLSRSDLPAAGWCRRLYRDGNLLKADFDDVAPEVARLIRGKRYKKVSAEVYDQPPEGVSGKGKMLRRVALLGADLPQIKSLSDIPLPEEHSEGRRFGAHCTHTFQFREAIKMPGGAWACFSEVKMLDHDGMVQKLAEQGLDSEALKDAPDQALAEMMRYCDSHGDHDQYEEPQGELPEPEGEEQASQYRERARKYRDLASRYSAYCDDDEMRQDHGEGEGEEVDAETAPPKGARPFSEKKAVEVVRRVVREEIDRGSKGALGELRKYASEEKAGRKKSAVEAFCEARAREGKLPPVEYKPAAQGGPGGPVFERLMRADSSAMVMKFNDKGKTVELTELDAQMREIEARGSLFAERLRSPHSSAPEDGEVARVEAHYEQFREHFPKTATKDSLVKGFKAARKRNEALTADEFLGK